MEKKHRSTVKFAIVALGLGLFSPSIDIGSTSLTNNADNTYTTALSINFTLFNEAEARAVHRQSRRVSRRTSRRTSARHNAYGGSRHYGYDNHSNTGAAVVAGMVVGAAVASSSNNNNTSN